MTSEKGCYFLPKKRISQQDDKEDEAGTTRSPETAACKVKCHGAYVTSALMSRGRKYQSEPISQNEPPKKVPFPSRCKTNEAEEAKASQLKKVTRAKST